MKPTTQLAATLLAIASALAAPTSTGPACTPPAATPSPFTIIAAHSGSPVHLQFVSAHDTQFFIGEATTS